MAEQNISLNEQLRIQSAVMHSAAHFIIATRVDGTIVLFNGAAERMLGYSAKEIIGKNTPVIFHDRDEVKEAARHLSRKLGRLIEPGLELFVTASHEEDSSEQEWTFIRKDGTRFFASLTVTDLHDEDGNLSGYLGIGNDITKRKQAEEALRRSEEQFRSLAASSPVGIFQTDPQGRCIYTNTRCQEIIGLTAEESLGEGWIMAVHPDDRQAVATQWQQCVRRNSVLSMEFRFLHKDGSVRSVVTRVGQIKDATGVVIGYVGTNQDITEQKEAEAEIVRARDAALEATNAKSLFLASMSHELRTPMNGVLGMAELLMHTPMTPEQRECAETIHSSGEALLTVLNDILDFSKIESGKLELESVSFDLRKIVQDTVLLFSQIASQKGVQLNCDIAPDIPHALKGDMVRTRQVLSNLISNAVKFTEQGQVNVTAEIERTDVDGCTWVRLSVSDSGIGIDEKGMERLFQHFSQGDASTTRRYGGTGLGLAISRHLTQLMGGGISVESAPNKGSIFSFTIPLQKSEVVPETEVSQTAPNIVGARILVGEDNRTNQIVIRRYLERRGCRIKIVETGHAVLEALEKEAFDLVLMDCHMPEMDGYEATRRLRRRELETKSDRPIPIVALTASAMNDDREQCLTAGMNDFMTKPVQFQSLDNMLNKWLVAR